MHAEDRNAPGPKPVAKAILQAAEDPSPRLRYPVKGALILALTTLLPDPIWRSLLGAGMTRRPKSSVDRSGAIRQAACLQEPCVVAARCSQEPPEAARGHLRRGPGVIESLAAELKGRLL